MKSQHVHSAFPHCFVRQKFPSLSTTCFHQLSKLVISREWDQDASLFHHGTTSRLRTQVCRSSKFSYIYWCALKSTDRDALVSLKPFLGPLHPSHLLSSCLGFPQLWLNVDFPLNGEVPQKTQDLQRNKCKSPVVLSIEKIPQGTKRDNYFLPMNYLISKSCAHPSERRKKKTAQKAKTEKQVQEPR